MCFVFAFFVVGLSIYIWNKAIDFFGGGDSGHLRGQSLLTSEQVTREIKKARVDTRRPGTRLRGAHAKKSWYTAKVTG